MTTRMTMRMTTMMTTMMTVSRPKEACRAAGGRPPVDRRVHGRRVSAVTWDLNGKDPYDFDFNHSYDNSPAGRELRYKSQWLCWSTCSWDPCTWLTIIIIIIMIIRGGVKKHFCCSLFKRGAEIFLSDVMLGFQWSMQLKATQAIIQRNNYDNSSHNVPRLGDVCTLWKARHSQAANTAWDRGWRWTTIDK